METIVPSTNTTAVTTKSLIISKSEQEAEWRQNDEIINKINQAKEAIESLKQSLHIERTALERERKISSLPNISSYLYDGVSNTSL